MCTYCNDTGSLDKDLDAYLDCTYCDVAQLRVELEAWAKREGIRVSAADLFLIYQRGRQAAGEPA